MYTVIHAGEKHNKWCFFEKALRYFEIGSASLQTYRTLVLIYPTATTAILPTSN